MGSKTPDKTNAVRILDKLKIRYDLQEYTVDPDNLAADHVAELLGQPIEKVYKTLVLKGDKTGYFVCVVAGNKEIDLKKAALVSGNKKAEMIPMKDLLSVTGYIRGGCTALGMKKTFPTFIDKAVTKLDTIFVSAGKRGLQIKMSVEDYLRVTSAKIVELSK